MEHIPGEFWELAVGYQGCCVHEERRQNFCVAVFARVHVQEKIRQSTLQACPRPAIKRKPRGRDLYGSRQIENSGVFADFPVWLRVEIKFRRRPQRRTSTFSSEPLPSGTEACNRLGTV